jgi:hypothetical protein
LGLCQAAHIEMTERLDGENYLEEETITIKIPFKLPYQETNTEFKRVHGDFRHDGEFYKLIKQKVENDTLYVICMKDKKEKKIFNFMADMAKVSAEMPSSSLATKLFSSLMKDYVTLLSTVTLAQQHWSTEFAYNDHSFNLLIRSYPIFSPPPKFLS